MFPLARFRVEQRSMSPVLEPGDYVLVNTWAYKFHPPQVGDLVVFTDPERPGRFLCKRIADVRGDGSYTVRGDNEAISRDSRIFGPVPRGRIVGKVWRAARGKRRRGT